MIQRIVKMTFRQDSIQQFHRLFEEVRERIRAQPGCHSVELLQDVRHPEIMFTYSQWDSEDTLNAYRQTELFVQTWKRTKSLFQERAEAWSVALINKA
ncbi:MAG: antibiotic biosynthesis monooxygenase [Saprospiraceae bacterium]|nr:antibiotic biosynthesis monooxygenase [Saprospiraceae bacterium]